jgi:two-component system sensor histidine kinase/response regulator
VTTVLVIEDEAPIRENIIEMLEMDGYYVLEADNGQTGLQLAQEHVPDLVICDITMPEMDGYDVLWGLRSEPETAAIPFVFLTARTARSFMRHGMELGADDYLTKPFTSAELLSAVEARLHRHEAILQETEVKLDQARHKLMQMVTHELRTPLASINMGLEIFARQLSLGQILPSQLQETLDSLSAGSKRLNRLVEQIVLITQLEVGALTRESVRQDGLPMRVSDVLIGAIDMARRFAFRHPDVIVRLDERDRDAVVHTDPRALKHALAEVVTNAIAFSPERGEVMIAYWEAEGSIWVSVTDQGPGIPEDQLAHVLADFQQIDREQLDQQGMGLGLPLAHRIIQTHGGELEISTAVGQGTRVMVRLPTGSGEVMWGG